MLLGHGIEPTEIELLGADPEKSESFWYVLAIFFPAVTGILAGVNMSGDLKNPHRSLPLGTFAAVLVGYVIYMGLPVVLAMRADATTLIENPMIMREIARWGHAILLGVWGATLSSAIGRILGAPRVLQALARDGVLPRRLRWLGRGSGPADLPRWGTLITLTIALVLVWTTDLITHGRGLITVAFVLPEDMDDAERQQSMQSAIRDHLSRRGIRALVRLIPAPDPYTGAGRLVESYGIGQVDPQHDSAGRYGIARCGNAREILPDGRYVPQNAEKRCYFS